MPYTGPFRNALGYIGSSTYNVDMAKLALAKLLADVRAKMASDAWWDAYRRRRGQQEELYWLKKGMLPVVPSWATVTLSSALGGTVSGLGSWYADYLLQRKLGELLGSTGKLEFLDVEPRGIPQLDLPAPYQSPYGFTYSLG